MKLVRDASCERYVNYGKIIKRMEAETAKININTIARLAKVSTSTVSSFINGTEVFPFSPETRLRVKEAMRELNYRPHIGGFTFDRQRGELFLYYRSMRLPDIHRPAMKFELKEVILE